MTHGQSKMAPKRARVISVKNDTIRLRSPSSNAIKCNIPLESQNRLFEVLRLNVIEAKSRQTEYLAPPTTKYISQAVLLLIFVNSNALQRMT